MAAICLDLHILQLSVGDVGGELDDAIDLAGLVDQRIVRALNPDGAPAPGDAAELGRHEPASQQIAPEGGIRRALHLGGIDEYRVMLANDVGELVAHDLQEVDVGGNDLAVRIELDDRQRTIESGKHRSLMI